MPTNNILPYSLSFFKPGARVWEQVQECENTSPLHDMFFTAARYPHRCAYQHRCAYSALPHHISKEKAHRNYYSDELLIFVFYTLLIIYTLLLIHTSLSSSSPPIKTAKTSKPDGKIIKWNRSFGCFFCAFMGENWKCGMRRKLGDWGQWHKASFPSYVLKL